MTEKELYDKLMNFPTVLLREINGEIIKDAIICVKDNVPFHSWVEDVREAPADYTYDDYDLEQFLYHIS